MVPNARVPDYRLLQRRIGTSRSVVVTPAPYPASVADNKVTLDAITEFGAHARGVAIVSPTMTDAELKTLAAGGICGIRFSLALANTARRRPSMRSSSCRNACTRSGGMCSST